MARRIGTFCVSLAAALAIAFAAVRYGEGPRPLVWVAILSLLLSVIFSLAAAYLGLYPRPTLAGLTAGALLVTLALVFFDWTLGRPETAKLSAASFSRYLRLYVSPSSFVLVAAPVLIAIAGFFCGRGLFVLLLRKRA